MIRIPPWVLRIALLLSLPIAAAALYLTRTYAVGNLAILGLDADTVFVRRLSIDVLLAAHVAAFFLCALLPDSVFRFRRWQLYALAIAIWVFDAGAIYQARFGVMDSADRAQVAAVDRVADMRTAIKGLQDSASALRVTAARQMANKMITKGAESQQDAANLEAQAAAMARQLTTMPTGAGTTEVRTWGWLAPYKAATESALISFVSLIMLGLAGLMLRELLQPAVARHATAPAPSPAPQAAPVPTKPSPAERTPTPAPKKAAEPAPAPSVSYSSKVLKTAGLGLAGIGAATAPAAHSAPAVPQSAPAAAPRPTPEMRYAIPIRTAPKLSDTIPAAIPGKSTGVPEEVCTSIPVRVCPPQKSEPVEVWDSTPTHTPAHTRKKQVPAKQVILTVPEIEKLKTDPKFQELRVQVAANKVRVSIMGIRQFSKVGQEKAAIYREALFTEFPQLRNAV